MQSKEEQNISQALEPPLCAPVFSRQIKRFHDELAFSLVNSVQAGWSSPLGDRTGLNSGIFLVAAGQTWQAFPFFKSTSCLELVISEGGVNICITLTSKRMSFTIHGGKINTFSRKGIGSEHRTGMLDTLK